MIKLTDMYSKKEFFKEAFRVLVFAFGIAALIVFGAAMFAQVYAHEKPQTYTKVDKPDHSEEACSVATPAPIPQEPTVAPTAGASATPTPLPVERVSKEKHSTGITMPILPPDTGRAK